MNHHHAVRAGVDVQLEPLGAEVEGEPEAGEAILAQSPRHAPVRNPKRGSSKGQDVHIEGGAADGVVSMLPGHGRSPAP